jgi:5,10-methenyltetrahydrofolate synthetase
MNTGTAIPDKKRLRQEVVARRDALPASARARIARTLTERLTDLAEFRAARSVLATMSIGSEWDTRPFLEAAQAEGKAIVLPRISAPPRRLELYVVDNLATDLVPGVWSIPEPDPARCARVEFGGVDFAVVPALLVDREGYRLGYGAGYFDRLLAGRAQLPYCVTALAAPFVVEGLPREAHDVAVDFVIDDAGRHFRAAPRGLPSATGH